jgi:DNA polymerase-3 subunit beta
MKIQCPKETLSPLLNVVAGAVERRHTIPILANIRLDCHNSLTTLVGTDLELRLAVQTEMISILEGGSTTLPAKRLIEIVKTADTEDPLSLQVDQTQATISYGATSFNLPALPADDFPAAPEVDDAHEFELHPQALRKLIQSTAFAIGHQDVRQYLNGWLLEIDNATLTAVATNGHRLSLAKTQRPPSATHSAIERALIPKKTVNEITKVINDEAGPVRIRFNRNHIELTQDRVTLQSNLINSQFPDYNKVIPRNNSNCAKIDRGDFRKSLQKAAILSNDQYRTIHLRFTANQLSLESRSADNESFNDVIAVNYQGPELPVSFNVHYLLDVTGVLDTDEIEMQLEDSETPCLVKPSQADDSQLNVIMPVRL